MKTYTITKEQLQAIESGLTLANYFVQDNAGGSMVEQWEKDAQTLDTALMAFRSIEQGARPMKILYESFGTYGFDHKDMFITDPTQSECGRFEVDPDAYYGINEVQAKTLALLNGDYQKKYTLAGVDFPEPIFRLDDLIRGQEYWVVDLVEPYKIHWTAHPKQYAVFSRGLIHKTEEGAFAHGGALQAINRITLAGEQA